MTVSRSAWIESASSLHFQKMIVNRSSLSRLPVSLTPSCILPRRTRRQPAGNFPSPTEVPTAGATRIGQRRRRPGERQDYRETLSPLTAPCRACSISICKDNSICWARPTSTCPKCKCSRRIVHSPTSRLTLAAREGPDFLLPFRVLRDKTTLDLTSLQKQLM